MRTYQDGPRKTRRCLVWDEPVSPSQVRLPWASHVAHDNTVMQWGHAEGVRVELPQVGDPVSLRVNRYFHLFDDTPFHVIVRPPSSMWNGWADVPEEIPASALVSLQLRAVDIPSHWAPRKGEPWWKSPPSQPPEAIVTADVLKVLRMDALPDTDASTLPSAGDTLIIPHCHHELHRYDVAGLTLFEGDGEGVGGWALLRGDVVWLYEQWNFGDGIVHVGPARAVLHPEQVSCRPGMALRGATAVAAHPSERTSLARTWTSRCVCGCNPP